MQKHTIVFAVETNKDGIVIRIGRSEILQPSVNQKNNPATAKRKEVVEK